MNLCISTSSFPAFADDALSAAGLFVRDFCCELRDLGHSVTVITPDKHAPGKTPPEGIRVIWYPWRGGDKRISYLKPYFPSDACAMISLLRQGFHALADAHRRHGFDHVLAMWTVPSGYLAMHLKKRAAVPYSVWSLGSDINRYGANPLFRPLVRRVLRNADHRFANSEDLCAKVGSLCGRGCVFLPSIRNFSSAEVVPARLDGPRPRFLFIGRYSREKGTDILVEAMARYIHGHGTGSLYMLGDGPQRNLILKRVEKKGIGGRVTVGGFAGEREIVAHLKACDAVVIPSRSESLPAVLSEASQFGKPAIASDVGDLGLLLRRYHAGIAVKRKDPDGLVNAMRQFESQDAGKFHEGLVALRESFDLHRAARHWCYLIKETRRHTKDTLE